MKSFSQSGTGAFPVPQDQTVSLPANPVAVGHYVSHQYDNINLSDHANGIFGNIVAQNVNLVINAETRDALKALLSTIITNASSSPSQHKISKSTKRSFRHKEKQKIVRTSLELAKLSNNDRILVRSSKLPGSHERSFSNAERMFTRALLQRFGMYPQDSVHRIDDLPFMQIALRMARAIDAYLTNWVMTESDKDVYRASNENTLNGMLNTFLVNYADPSTQEPNSKVVRQFEPIRDVLSPEALMVILANVNKLSEPHLKVMAKLSAHVFGPNHPVTFILHNVQLGHGLPGWMEIVYHHLFNWVGRIISEHRFKLGPSLDYAIMGPARMYYRILDPRYCPLLYTDIELHASCIKEAITQCSPLYPDEGCSINALRSISAFVAKERGDVSSAKDAYCGVYDKAAAQSHSGSIGFKVEAAYRLGGIYREMSSNQEASDWYMRVIDLRFHLPEYCFQFVKKSVQELYDLTHIYGGHAFRETLMAKYPAYFVQDWRGEVVLKCYMMPPEVFNKLTWSGGAVEDTEETTSPDDTDEESFNGFSDTEDATSKAEMKADD